MGVWPDGRFCHNQLTNQQLWSALLSVIALDQLARAGRLVIVKISWM